MYSLRQLLFVLLFAQLAFAAEITQYVTTPCTHNGDGTAASCAASGGAAGAFNSLSNWESQNTNLDTANNNLTVVFSGTFTSNMTVDGWTTSATDRILLSGLVIDADTYGANLVIADPYVTCRGCSIAKGGGTLAVIVEIQSPNTTWERSLVFSQSDHTNDGGSHAFKIPGGGAGGTTTIRNSIFHSGVAGAISLGAGASETINFDNNTIANFAGGGGSSGAVQIEIDGGSGQTFNVYNNIVQGTASGDDWFVSTSDRTYNHDNNISEDATSPDTDHRSKTITFVNAAADDYHLDPSETDAIDQGTDRSGAGFSNDYDGDTRTGTWDIGADETSSATANFVILLTETLGY